MHVAVIGGGYAGMAAAVTLAGRGIPVTVFEAARELGGRARRVEYRGTVLDNGQHILSGAYRETLRLVTQVHPSPPLLRLPLEWRIDDRFALRAAPFHIAAGLLAARGAPFTERWRALRFVLALRRRNFRLAQDTTVADLLRQHEQGENLSRFFWEPLCLAALNTPPQAASAQVFLNVLRDSLHGGRDASDLLLPRSDLSALFPDHAAAYVAAHGGAVHRLCPVGRILPEGEGYAVLAKGRRLFFSHVVCAVPPSRLAALVADLPELADAAAQAGKLSCQPIYTVYLQYPRQASLPAAMQGLGGGMLQWVFDRGRLCGQQGLFGAVISAEGAHQELGHEELAQRAHEELRQRFPHLPAPLWHKVIAEKRATFACVPNLQRPSQLTSRKNFYLAGDYTASDYPATLEAAVRSGVVCAGHIIEGW